MNEVTQHQLMFKTIKLNSRLRS